MGAGVEGVSVCAVCRGEGTSCISTLEVNDVQNCNECIALCAASWLHRIFRMKFAILSDSCKPISQSQAAVSRRI